VTITPGLTFSDKAVRTLKQHARDVKLADSHRLLYSRHKGSLSYLCVKQKVTPIISVKDIHLFTVSCVSIVSTDEIALYQRQQVLWGSLPVTFPAFWKDLLQSNYVQRVLGQITKLFA
jgi:hypothetical protein